MREKQASYVLALRKNHKRFYRKVESAFARINELQFKNMVSRETNMDDSGHQGT